MNVGVQRGDLFLDDYGNYLEMDNLGRLLGIRCLGQTIKKSGAWFRPLEQNDSGLPSLTESED